jgi:hypothetical protein
MYRKTIFSTLGILLMISSAFSQNHIEALRYSQQFYSSTAKSDAMGNALSVVGADLSSTTINPAGIAVYKTTQFAFTPNFIVSTTNGTFSENSIEESKYGFNFSNIGYVGVIKTNGIVKNINFGVNYNSTNDFRQTSRVSADNQNGSIMDYIVYNANSLDNRYSDFREDLAWRGWLLNYDEGVGEYWSFITDDGTYGITQRNYIRTRGGAGEFDLSIGANLGDKFYIGSTIGFATVNYHEESVYSERNFPTIYAQTGIPGDSVLANPNTIEYSQDLYTTGSGINFKIGAIYQPVSFLRIGGSFHTPTLYEFEDEYEAEMYIDYPVADEFGYYDYRPDTANVYEWNLVTPMRANAGIALILGSYEMGKFFTIPMILSVDYEYVDYSRTKMNPVYYDDYSFDTENDYISVLYKETHNFRAGLELNFGAFKARGGYALYQSPYVIDAKLFDHAKTIYSAGIGFGSEHAYIDFSYSYAPSTSTMYLYNANNLYPNDPMGGKSEPTATLDNTKQFFKMTMGLRF